jgi:hypothetical protein
VCGRFHQHAVHGLLIAADDFVEFLGQGEDQVEIRRLQQFLTALLEPEFRLFSLTFGTAPILAGVVGVPLVSTAVAGIDVSTHGRGTTMENVVESAAMTGQHLLTKPLQVRITVAAKDVRDFQHGRP